MPWHQRDALLVLDAVNLPHPWCLAASWKGDWDVLLVRRYQQLWRQRCHNDFPAGDCSREVGELRVNP